MPVGGARYPHAEVAERLDVRREQAGLGDLADLDLAGQPLLRRLTPEGREIRRDREGVEDLHAFLLEQRDLRGIVGRTGFIGARIDDGETLLGEQRREVGADGVAVGVVRIHDADLLVGLDQVPLRDVGLEELADAEAEMIGPFEGRRRARLGAAAEVPGFPWHDRRQTGYAGRFAGISHRVDHLRRRDREHQVDGLVVDQVLGELAGARWVRLRVLVENFDTVFLAAELDAVGQRLAGKIEHVAVGLAKAGKRAGARADEADLQRFGALGEGRASAERERRAAGHRGGEELAPRDTAGDGSVSGMVGHLFLP